MFFLLICGALCYQTHGFKIPYGSSHPASYYQGSHTYETSQPDTGNQGSHTYETSQPEITHTHKTSQPDGQTSHFVKYSWQTQWQQKYGWVWPNDGTFGQSQDTYRGSQIGTGRDDNNPSQGSLSEMDVPFNPDSTPDKDVSDNSQVEPTDDTINIDDKLESPHSTPEKDVSDHSQAAPTDDTINVDDNSESPHSTPGNDINDNSQASSTDETINDDDIDDKSEPPQFPGDINDDEDDEGSGDSEILMLDVASYKINHTIATSDKNSDDTNSYSDEIGKDFYPAPSDGIPGKKNDTKPSTPRPMTQRPPYGPDPGTMSRPVPKLGLLFAPSLQWHVGVYSKTFTPYMQVCGGSLVKTDVVLSAAHCFWNDDVGALRPGLFAVAAGKLLRPWETEGEIYTQHSDIRDIIIPPRFRGSKTSFQDDIAVVILTRALELAPGVKPVCVSFDHEVEQKHLTSGNMGTIAGWGLTQPNGLPSQRLNFLELPYVDIEDCLRTAVDSFLKYITSDKICAGDQKTGRALCRGDSGGGLIYYSSTIPYLHGIASTAPKDDNRCNAFAVASFTHVLAHRSFLIKHVPDIGEGCEELYINTTGLVQNETTSIKPENAAQTLTGPVRDQEDRIMANSSLQTVSNGPQILLAASQDATEPLEDRRHMSETNEELMEKEEQNVGKWENETEVVMNVGSGERGVVRVPVDDTRTLVCNCYCNK